MRKAELTRQFIIEKSAPIFNKLGYANTSMQDLTSATGLTKGSIYGNFENKDEVAVEAFRFNLGKMVRMFEDAMSGRRTFREKLLVYPEIYERFFSDDFVEGGCPILNTAIEADFTHPTLKAKARQAFSSWKSTISELVRSGKQSGEFKESVDTEATAIAILALIEGGTMIAKLTGDENQMLMVTAHLRHLINTL